MTEINFDAIFSSLPDKPLLRVDEVAAFFDVKKRTIYSWYPDKLQGTNINGVLRIYRESVISLVKANNCREKDTETEDEIEEKFTDASKQLPHRPKTGSGWVKKW